MKSCVWSMIVLLAVLVPVHAQTQWESMQGPVGGSVYALAEGPDGSLYAGMVWGGAFRSDDGGLSWVPVFEGMSTTQVMDFAINPTGEVYSAGSNGILQLSPTKDSWLSTGSPSYLQSVVVNSSGDIFSAGNYVRRRLDGESGWNILDSGITSGDFRVMVVDGDDRLYVGGWGDGVYVSEDNGESWEQVNSGLSIVNVQSMTVTSDNRVFAGTWGGGVFRSDDFGQNWVEMNTGLDESFVMALAASPGDTLLAGTNSGGVFVSVDTGATWTRIDSGFGYLDVRSVLPASNQHYFAGTEGGGVYRSTDYGTSWTQENTGLAASYVGALSLTSDSGSLLTGSSGSGLWLWDIQAAQWQLLSDSVLPPTATVYSLGFNALGDMIAGTRYSGLVRSQNAGTSWQQLTYNGARVEHILLYGNGYLFIGSSGSGVYRSINDGDSWERVPLRGTSTVYTRGLALGTDGVIFAATSDSGVYISSDTGATWTQANTGIDELRCWCMTSGPQGAVFVGTNRGLYRTMDNGQQWERLDSASLPYSVYSVHVRNDNEIYAGTASSLHFSSDSGAQFFTIDEGLFNKNIQSIIADSAGSVYVGTGGNGLYRSLGQVTGTLPAPRGAGATASGRLVRVRWMGGGRFEVLFKESLTGPVSIELYTLMGQRVAVFNGTGRTHEAHRIAWDVGRVASGVYQFRITSGNHREMVHVEVVH